MAKEKKGFILYTDLIHTIKKLSKEQAGELFNYILDYVNDKGEPKIEDQVLDIAFEPIKRQLKRDLSHWEDVKKIRSENGRKGGRPKKEEAKKANGFSEKLTKAKKAVIVNGNVNVSVNDINSSNKVAPNNKNNSEFGQLLQESVKKKGLIPPKYQWQDEALQAIEVLGAEKKSSIFKCYKENNRTAKLALNECKELNKTHELYFLKVYNEQNK